MRRPISVTLMAALLILPPLAASAQDNRAALEPIAKAMGAGSVKSIQYSGNGANFQVGQNYSPDLPWPRFVVKSFTRTVSYETASIRDEIGAPSAKPRSAAAAVAAWLRAPSSARISRRAVTSPGT